MTSEETELVRLDDVLPDSPAPDDPVAHIGVVVSLNYPQISEDHAGLVRRFTKVALSTLVDHGAGFTLLDTSHPLTDPEGSGRFDGLLVLGGGDIDACTYGSTGTAPNSYGVDPRADRDALAAIRSAESSGKPVLGICRGSQLLNVARGGTVVPDIEDYHLHRGGPGRPTFIDEHIGIEQGTRLAEILGTAEVVARSGHHQAVDAVGEGLVVAATALDGVVEGVEDPARWYVGVQWHPEDDHGPAADRERLFAAFVEASVSARLARNDDSAAAAPLQGTTDLQK